MNQIAIVWQFIISFIFWAIIAPVFIPEANFIWKIGLVLSHLVPLGILLLNFWLTDSRLKFLDQWHSLLLASLYSTLNYFFTAHNDEPVYPFLTWEDASSALECFVSFSVGMVCYSILCFVDAKCKGRNLLDSC